MIGGPPAGSRLAPLLALGVSLARRGVLPIVALAICALTTLGMIGVTIFLALRGSRAPLHDAPLVASTLLAWGGGFLEAFAAAAHALRRDRAEGIRDLLALRTTSLRRYLVARVGGLAVLIAAAVGGGTLLVGLVATIGAARLSAAPRALQATLASLVFSVAFAAVVAPLAFAALGARSRIGGYLFLLAVVVIPEVLAATLSSSLPAGILDVLAIPSALGALRSSLAPGGVDPLRALRAVLALAAWAAVAVFLVRREAILLERPEAPA